MDRHAMKVFTKSEATVIAALAIATILAGLASYRLSIAKGDNIASAAASVMLQAMERGYQCRIDGRTIDECKDEQRKRWKAHQ
jgi:hypothetical protein